MDSDTPINTALTKCERTIDIGFIMDSSGSLRHYYRDEKNFLKHLSEVFGVTKEGSHAGVLTFSTRAQLNIRLNQYSSQYSFNSAVDRIPYMSGGTRIDLGLRYGFGQLFSLANGARTNVVRLMVLITDGSQSRLRGARDPAEIAQYIRSKGIQLLVIGIGNGINKKELGRIAGGTWYSAKNWDELKSGEFLHKMSQSICKTAKG